MKNITEGEIKEHSEDIEKKIKKNVGIACVEWKEKKTLTYIGTPS
jgi:hypothetical protein